MHMLCNYNCGHCMLCYLKVMWFAQIVCFVMNVKLILYTRLRLAPKLKLLMELTELHLEKSNFCRN